MYTETWEVERRSMWRSVAGFLALAVVIGVGVVAQGLVPQVPKYKLYTAQTRIETEEDAHKAFDELGAAIWKKFDWGRRSRTWCDRGSSWGAVTNDQEGREASLAVSGNDASQVSYVEYSRANSEVVRSDKSDAVSTPDQALEVARPILAKLAPGSRFQLTVRPIYRQRPYRDAVAFYSVGCALLIGGYADLSDRCGATIDVNASDGRIVRVQERWEAPAVPTRPICRSMADARGAAARRFPEQSSWFANKKPKLGWFIAAGEGRLAYLWASESGDTYVDANTLEVF